MYRVFKFLTLLIIVNGSAWGDVPVIGHALDVRLHPSTGMLQVTDRLTLPQEQDVWVFFLHKGLEPKVQGDDARLRHLGSDRHLERYELTRNTPEPVTLTYEGTIRHDMEAIQESVGRSRSWTRGTIAESGVFLDGFSGWYPRIPETLQRFDLKIVLPEGWTAVSQGAGPSRSGNAVRWTETSPQDDIYLVAAPFHLYRKATPIAEAQVYLRSPNEDLAGRYLEATADYLAVYSGLIGPYPYSKFALVENFWETGYGMPSFTLLGPRVIQLPFILHTSYPHEILHNWWGNGVFVDFDSGNWSEGLTAYLADHLNKERQGRGADYRRDSLKSFADYVRTDKDFPLSAFRGRHSSASQAIGYGKMLMVLHMLRRDLGDQAFIAGLQTFYRDNLFRAAGIGDLREAFFEEQTDSELTGWFNAWTGRTGAPALAVSQVQVQVQVQPRAGGYRIIGRLAQTQRDAPFPLNVPLQVHQREGAPIEQRVRLDGRDTDFEILVQSRPIRLAVDPGFDLFRQLVDGESPSTLSNLFGADRGLILLPSTASGALAAEYSRLARAWTHGHQGWQVLDDDVIDELPGDRPVWLLGWDNRFLADLDQGQSAFTLEPSSKRAAIAGRDIDGTSTSLVLTHSRDGRVIGWLGAHDPAAVPGLARKLPHYGKYSYLAFDGTAPVNRLKGQWPVNESPLVIWFTDERPSLPLPKAPVLTDAIEG